MWKPGRYMGIVTHYSREEIGGVEVKTIVIALAGTNRSIDLIFKKGERSFTAVGDWCFGKMMTVAYLVNERAHRAIQSIRCD